MPQASSLQSERGTKVQTQRIAPDVLFETAPVVVGLFVCAEIHLTSLWPGSTVE